MVDVGIFGKMIDIFVTEKALMGKRSILPVMVAEYFGSISHFEMVEMQAVDKVLVFTIMIK
jgi:hypothetical protein